MFSNKYEGRYSYHLIKQSNQVSFCGKTLLTLIYMAFVTVEPEENNRLVAKLTLLFYHETSSTKTTQKPVFPELLPNQFTVYNRLHWEIIWRLVVTLSNILQ